MKVNITKEIRALFGFVAVACGALLFPLFAYAAEGLGTEPIRFLVGFSPGGGADIVARAIGTKLSESLGQNVIVDTRPGASGAIATGILAISDPNGRTLMLGSIGQLAVTPSLRSNLPFDIAKDLAPVTKVSSASNILCLHPTITANNVRELLALAKIKSLNGGSSGYGNTGHLAIELLNMMAGIKIVHVPYKGGGSMIVGLLGGNVDLGFANPSTAITFIKQGKLKGIAVSTAKRSRLMPDLPTVAESGLPGFDVNNWIGVVVAARTPRTIIDRLNREIVTILKTPEITEFLFRQGIEADPSTPEEFGNYIKSETIKWARVVKAAGIKAE